MKRDPLVWFVVTWLLLLTFLLVARPAGGQTPQVFDNPVTIRITDPLAPALIVDATGAAAHGAWIQYKVKCYGYPGPCEFAGSEVEVYEVDGSARLGDVPRFNYSPQSDAWEAYGWHGCIEWNQQGLLRFCGPNGEHITTAIGGLSLEPWRNLLLNPNACAQQGACEAGAFHTFVAGQMAVGDCDNTAPGRSLTVCGNTSGSTILRLVNEGAGDSVLEWIGGGGSRYEGVQP